MMYNKILIIDDKANSEDFSTSLAITQLTEVEITLVDYFENTESLWKGSDNEDIIFYKDFSIYPFIFIHDSFDDQFISDGLKAVLIEKLSKTSKVVLFSGSKIESEHPIEKIYNKNISRQTKCYEILRRQYFNNLRNFLKSYLVTGEYQIKYLYNPYINPKKDLAYSLLEIIKTNLEESIQSAIESNSFNKLLSLYGHKNTAEISNMLLKMTDDEFIETLEDFIENI